MSANIFDAMTDVIVDKIVSQGTAVFRTVLQERGFDDVHTTNVTTLARSLDRINRSLLDDATGLVGTALSEASMQVLASNEPVELVAFAVRVLDEIDRRIDEKTLTRRGLDKTRDLAAGIAAVAFLAAVEGARLEQRDAAQSEPAPATDAPATPGEPS